VVVAKGVGRIDQHQVEVALKPAVLEAIVENEHVHVGMLAEHRFGPRKAIGLGMNDHRGAGVGCVEQLVEQLLFVASGTCLGLISAKEDRRVHPVLAQAVCQPTHDGVLPVPPVVMLPTLTTGRAARLEVMIPVV
jgi:hypothetical protein